jgi:hypothetical protein
MSQDFGIQMPVRHEVTAHSKPVKYLVLIESGGGMLAKLFLESRELSMECDAAAAEVASMTADLTPEIGACAPAWDAALCAFDPKTRASAEIFTLTAS